MTWVILSSLVSLTIHIVVSNEFAKRAEEKGHQRSDYFLICFFFGVIGYCLAASLPDLIVYDEIDKLKKRIHTLEKEAEQRAAAMSADPDADEPEPAVTPEIPTLLDDEEDGVLTDVTITADGRSWVCPSCGRNNMLKNKTCWCCDFKREK